MEEAVRKRGVEGEVQVVVVEAVAVGRGAG